MKTTFRKEALVCGCCGMGFDTRPTYKDQDQDDGYGICKGCQKSATKKNNDWYHETFDMIYNGLSEKNKATCDKRLQEVGIQYKVILVNIALDKGWIKRTI